MKFLKKLRPFDLIIIGLILIALAAGAMTLLGKHITSKKQIEATTKVDIEVYFRGVVVTHDECPFEKGDETFITIRNVPYTKLKITDVSFDRKKTMMPNGNSYRVFDDVTIPFTYDFLVTVEDTAKITKDGAVVGGNKIKMGLPITLEGVDYKFNGVVSGITLAKEPDGEKSDKGIEAQVNQNQDVH